MEAAQKWTTPKMQVGCRKIEASNAQDAAASRMANPRREARAPSKEGGRVLRGSETRSRNSDAGARLATVDGGAHALQCLRGSWTYS